MKITQDGESACIVATLNTSSSALPSAVLNATTTVKCSKHLPLARNKTKLIWWKALSWWEAWGPGPLDPLSGSALFSAACLKFSASHYNRRIKCSAFTAAAKISAKPS